MSRTSLLFVLGAEGLALAALLTVALDQYAHTKVQMVGGLNRWGYRGAVAPARQPDEIRVAVVGGDHAFAFGMAPAETTTVYLRDIIERSVPRSHTGRVTAVNLGAMGLAARAYAGRIEAFAGVAPDVLCLYVDVGRPASDARLPQLESGVRVMTGYMPALPVVLEEKGFGRALGRLDRWWFHQLDTIDAPDPDRDAAYVADAVGTGLSVARAVVVAIPPGRTAAARHDAAALQATLAARWGADPRVRVVALGQPPMVYGDDLFVDGMHLGAAGQWQAAQEIAPAVIDLLRAAGLMGAAS